MNVLSKIRPNMAKLYKFTAITRSMTGGQANLNSGVAELATSENNPNPIIKSEKYKVIEEQKKLFYYPVIPSPYFNPQNPFRRPVPAPSSQEEVYLISNVRYSCNQKIDKVLVAMFRGGRRSRTDKSMFKHNDIIVLVEGCFVAEINKDLPPGGWFNKSTLEYGLDIISLYSVVKDISYKTALYRLAESLSEIVENEQKSNKPWGKQVKAPVLAPDFHSIGFSDCQMVHSAEYKSVTDQIIEIVEYWKLPDEEEIRINYTLWKHYNSEIVYWMPILSSKPLFYELDKIKQNPESLIIIVADERQADHYNMQNNTDKVYTTCSGGLQKLLKADLSALRGRDIVIELNALSPEVLPDFLNTTSKEKINVFFSFEGEKDWISEADFRKDPGKWGFEGVLDGIRHAGSEPIVIPPGKIPDADKKRKVILYPIIFAGLIIWLYARTGVGKSWMAIMIAYAVAKGNCRIGRWSSAEPLSVMYIDGEMKRNELYERIRMVMAGQGDEGDIPFYICSADSYDSGVIDILDPEWQKSMEASLKKMDLIILDNFYCLTENKLSNRKPAMAWIKKLSKQGITVLVLDHANSEGKLQGGGAKAWPLDLIINLKETKEPAEYDDYVDKSFENYIQKIDNRDLLIVKFCKSRSLPPDVVAPFVLKKVSTQDTFRFEEVQQTGGKQPVPGKDKKFAEIVYLKKEKGFKNLQISKELGIPENTIQHRLTHQIPKLPYHENLALEQAVKSLVDKEKQILNSDDVLIENARPEEVKSKTVKKLVDYNPDFESGDESNKYNEYKQDFISDIKDSDFDGERAWRDLVFIIANYKNIPDTYLSFIPVRMLTRLTSEGWNLDGEEGIPPN